LNISIGGLTDAGKPHYGIVGLFYSIAMIHSIFFEMQSWGNSREELDMVLMTGLGLCNILIFLSPISLLLSGWKARLARCVMTVAATYVCIFGFVAYRDFPRLYGYYVWCLSFVIVAVAQYIDFSKMKALTNRRLRPSSVSQAGPR
jgi:hypothetical protein